MEEIALKIHKELAEALDNNSLDFLKDKKIGKDIPYNLEKYSRILSDSGFVNTPLCTELSRKVRNKTEIIKSNFLKKETLIRLESLKEYFPVHRIISYPALHAILLKYDLYLGPSDKFIKDVPAQNSNDIDRFNKSYLGKKKLDGCYKSDFEWISSKSIYKKFELINDYREKHNKIEFAVAATIDNFLESRDRIAIGRELEYNIAKPKFEPEIRLAQPMLKDPIILAPFRYNLNDDTSIKMFAIVTAWGKESTDKEIINTLMN